MTDKQAYAGLLERLVARRNGYRGTLLHDGTVAYEETQCEVPNNPDGPEAAEAISSLLKALAVSVGALGRVNVRCFDTPTSPLKPTGDIARDALASVAAMLGDELYDQIAVAALNSDAPLSIGEAVR